MLELGSLFGKKGLIASGLFKDGQLLQTMNVENQASDFMALSGKYTTDYRMNGNIGEHNSNKKLHGKGLRIFPNGTVWIQSWSDGERVAGSYLNIRNDGAFTVGECYVASLNGRLAVKYNHYSNDELFF